VLLQGLRVAKNRSTASSHSDASVSRSSTSPLPAEVSVAQSSISEAHIILGKRRRRDAEDTEMKRPKILVEEETAIEWVGALQKLIKGKTRMDREVRPGRMVLFQD
jgi:hypothetical protein